MAEVQIMQEQLSAYATAPTVRSPYSGHLVLRPTGRSAVVQQDLLEQITTASAGLRSKRVTGCNE